MRWLISFLTANSLFLLNHAHIDLSYIYVIMWHIMQVMVREYSRLRMLAKSGKIRESLIAARCYPITFQDWNKKNADFQTFLSLDIDFWRTNEHLVRWKLQAFHIIKNFSFQALPWSFSQKCALVALYPIWKMRNISFFPHSDCLLMFNSFWIFTDSRHETDFSRTWIAWPYKRSRILEVDDDDVPGLSEPGEGRGALAPPYFW